MYNRVILLSFIKCRAVVKGEARLQLLVALGLGGLHAGGQRALTGILTVVSTSVIYTALLEESRSSASRQPRAGTGAGAGAAGCCCCCCCCCCCWCCWCCCCSRRHRPPATACAPPPAAAAASSSCASACATWLSFSNAQEECAASRWLVTRSGLAQMNALIACSLIARGGACHRRVVARRRAVRRCPGSSASSSLGAHASCCSAWMTEPSLPS